LAIGTNVGTGCGGRGSVERAMVVAGRISVSDRMARRRPATRTGGSEQGLSFASTGHFQSKHRLGFLRAIGRLYRSLDGF